MLQGRDSPSNSFHGNTVDERNQRKENRFSNFITSSFGLKEKSSVSYLPGEFFEEAYSFNKWHT